MLAHPGVRYQQARDIILSSNEGLGGTAKSFAIPLSDLFTQLGIPADITAYDPVAAWEANEFTPNLSVPIGRYDQGDVSGTVAVLDIAEHLVGGAGPHGCVQGMTGSGKSYFLTNLIASLAVTYSPTKLNLLLVDCKGDVSFRAVEGLPHVVGHISGKRGEQSVEWLALAIRTELNRRQAVLAERGVRDIAEYRALMATDATVDPLPYLVVVIDDVASYAPTHREFTTMVTTIATLGRSLGVHQVVSSQNISLAVSYAALPHMSYAIALPVNPVLSRNVLNGDPRAADLPLGTGQFMFRHHDTVERVKGLSCGTDMETVLPVLAASMTATGVAARDLLGDAAASTKYPDVVSSEGLFIGFDTARNAEAAIPETTRVVVVSGEACSGRTATLKTLIESVRRTHTPDQAQFAIVDPALGLVDDAKQLVREGYMSKEGYATNDKEAADTLISVMETVEARNPTRDNLLDSTATTDSKGHDSPTLFVIMDAEHISDEVYFAFKRLARLVRERDLGVRVLMSTGASDASIWWRLREELASSGHTAELSMNRVVQGHATLTVAGATPRRVWVAER